MQEQWQRHFAGPHDLVIISSPSVETSLYFCAKSVVKYDGPTSSTRARELGLILCRFREFSENDINEFFDSAELLLHRMYEVVHFLSVFLKDLGFFLVVTHLSGSEICAKKSLVLYE